MICIAYTIQVTVKSHEFEVLGTRNLFLVFSSSSQREVDIKIFNPQKIRISEYKGHPIKNETLSIT